MDRVRFAVVQCLASAWLPAPCRRSFCDEDEFTNCNPYHCAGGIRPPGADRVRLRKPARETGAGQVSVISVCDVLADLDSYRDRIAAVRGVFTYRGLRQDGCPTELITDNRHWPPVLDLAAVEGVWQRDGQKFTFRTDHAGWDGLERTAIEAGKQGQSVEIWATIVGQVGAVERRVLPDGRVIGGGYGHLGALPAELVVKEVKDVVVKPFRDRGMTTGSEGLARPRPVKDRSGPLRRPLKRDVGLAFG